MKIGRRRFLLAGAVLSSSGISRALEVSSFTLQFQVGSFEAGQVSIAAAASAPCTLQVQLFAGEKPLLESRKWSMESRRAMSVLNQGIGTAIVTGVGQQGLEVRAFVYPKGPKRPHIAIVIERGSVTDKDHLQQTAERLFFIKDPAPRAEEGHFNVDLQVNSNLTLRIWQGENAKRTLVHRRDFRNLQGQQPIPWNLRNTSGSIVDPDEYLATLIATPTVPNRSKTEFFASFQVI